MTDIDELHEQIEDFRALIDELTINLHKLERSVIEDHTDDIARDFKKIRAEVNAIRAKAGLLPSPVQENYPGEEDDG